MDKAYFEELINTNFSKDEAEKIISIFRMSPKEGATELTDIVNIGIVLTDNFKIIPPEKTAEVLSPIPTGFISRTGKEVLLHCGTCEKFDLYCLLQNLGNSDFGCTWLTIGDPSFA